MGQAEIVPDYRAPVPTARDVTIGGRRFGVLDWGGAGPEVLLLHPNGFCAGVFDPIASRLAGRFHCIGLDLVGHGASDPPADLASLSMIDVAAEAVAVLDALGLGDGPLHAIGQSLGGVVACLMDRARPGLFDRLLLCEAVVFPLDWERPADRPNMAEMARRRRAVWPNRAEMRERFITRPPLGDFAPESLDAYLHWGLVDRPDGQVELACPPAVEGAVFELTPTEAGSPPAWAHLPDLAAAATIISGRDTTLPDFFSRQASHAGVAHLVVPGGHLFPQEDPAAFAELAAGLLLGESVGGKDNG